MVRFARIVAVTALALSVVACSDLVNPLESDPEEAGLTINTGGCEYDPQTKIVTATFEVRSAEEDYSTVLVNGEVVDSTGVVIATSSTSVLNVRPGRTYRDSMVLSLNQDPEGEITCNVELDFANPGF